MNKIYHLYKTFYPFTHGGVESYIDSIINNKNKFDHYLISIGDKKFNNKKKIIFKKTLSYASDIISIDLLIFIYKNINKKSDLIHLHSPWPSMEMFLLIFGYKNIVVTYHSDIIRQKFINFFYRPFNIIFLKNNVQKIIATSKKYAETSKVLNKIEKNKISIIPIGISYILKPSEIKLDNRKNYILFIGSNRSYKGIPLLEIIIRSSNNKFVLIGSDLSKLKKYKNTKVYERISEKRKIELLSNASFLLMTSSSRNEAFGIVLVEALRSGLPIISPNLNTGVSWINENKKTGYIYQTNEASDLTKKIEKMNKLPIRDYLKLKSNSRMRFEKFFTLDIMSKKLDMVYSKSFNH